MNDYFDQFELELKRALSRRAHLPWHRRLRLPVRHRGLVVLIAALVVATPTVAAVGAVSGWFSAGKPDIYYPASSTSGLGKVLPTGDRLLPIRVADPDGGPPWGIRLVKTNRDATCIQVGRVVDGQIGQLGIDGAWHDDHEFHEIKPNDQLADICGATDSAGNGFVNWGASDAPASVDVPLDNSVGGPGRCLSPFRGQPFPILSRGGHVPPALKRALKRIQQERAASRLCPESGMRFIFTGLLGPDASSVTYKTPSGHTRTERTVGGVGAYLIVFRETHADCGDYRQTLVLRIAGCSGGGQGANADLQGPSAVISVSYKDGKTCSDQPSPSFAASYRAFEQKLSKRIRHESTKVVQEQWAAFDRAHGLTAITQFEAADPRCSPVGWVASKQTKLTAAEVASPIRVQVSEGKRFCVSGSQVGTFNGALPCDHRVPRGDRFLYGRGPGQEAVLVTISFTAHQPVTTANSYYEWLIQAPGNHGGEGGPTTKDIRAGQRLTLSMFVGPNISGVYHGTVAFVQNAGQNGPEPLSLLSRQHRPVPLTVGTFSFRLPLHR